MMGGKGGLPVQQIQKAAEGIDWTTWITAMAALLTAAAAMLGVWVKIRRVRRRRR